MKKQILSALISCLTIFSFQACDKNEKILISPKIGKPTVTPNTNPSNGNLIFQTGFENGVSIITKDAQTDEFIGTDVTFSKPNNWITDFVDHPNVGIVRIYYEAGNDSQRKACIVTDPVNPSNKVLNYKLVEPHINQNPYTVNGIVFDKKARIQMDLYGCNGLKEIYQSVRLFIPEDFNKFKNTKFPGNGDWVTIFEFWNNAHWNTGYTYPFRFGVTLKKTSAGVGSPLYFHSDGQKLVGGFVTMWEKFNTDFPVPIGKWMTIEYYIKDGNKGNGRFYLAVTPDGETKTVVFDLTNDTCHPDDPNPDGLSEINPLKLYTSNNMVNQMNNMGGVFQIYWDDFKLWMNRRP